MHKLSNTLIATGIAVGALLAGGAPAYAHSSPATASPRRPVALAGEFHQIRNVANNNVCLQPQASPFTRIVQVTCNGSSEQGWLALNDGNNRYRFVNGSGRGCMSVNDRPFDHAVVQLDNCTLSDGSGVPVSNAQWQSSRTLPNGDITLRTRVRNVTNNFCLNEPGGSPAEGLGIELLTCNGSPTQRWSAGFN
jgi:hypothetical protein